MMSMEQQNTDCQQDDGLLMDENYYAELEAYYSQEEPYEPTPEDLECGCTMAKYNGWYDDEYVLLNPMPCELVGTDMASRYEEGRAL